MLIGALQAAQAAERPDMTGQWAVSVGGAYYAVEVTFEDMDVESAQAGAVALTAEHYFHPAFSLELGVQVTPRVNLGLFRADDLLFRGDQLRADLKLQGVSIVLAGKLYPLRLAGGRLARFRLRPYVSAGAAAVILPLELQGQYRYPPDINLIRIELTETAGAMLFGGGVDVYLTSRWALLAEVMFLETISKPQLEILSTVGSVRTRFGVELDTVIVRIAMKYVF